MSINPESAAILGEQCNVVQLRELKVRHSLRDVAKRQLK